MEDVKEQETQPDADTVQEDRETSPGAAMQQMALTQAMSLAMHNAVAAQQNAQILNNAMVTSVCARILQARRHTAGIHTYSAPGDDMAAADNAQPPAAPLHKKKR